MKTLKKTLCLVLAVVMAVGVLVIPANAAEFTDADEITHDEAVAVLNGLGIVSGVGDGSFNPSGTFTRLEAAILLARVVLTPDGVDDLVATRAIFDDVPVTDPYNKYITWAVENDYIHGVGDNKFNPTGKLTGVQLAAMMIEALGEKLPTDGSWENFVAQKVKEYKLTDGITGYSATAVISRDNAVQMMYNTMTASPSGEKMWGLYEMGKDGKATGNPVETFSSIVEAYAARAVLGSDKFVVDAAVASDSILAGYNVSTSDAPDAYGRPQTSVVRTVNGKTTVLYSVKDEPVLEYTTEVSYKKIYTDLELDEETSADVIQLGKTWHVDFDLTNTKTIDYTGNGCKTEVYDDGDGTYTIVCIPVLLVKANKTTTSTDSATGKKTVSQSFARLGGNDVSGVAGPFASTKFINYPENTVLMMTVTTDKNGAFVIQSLEEPDVVTGKLERTTQKNNGPKTYYIDGAAYLTAYDCVDEFAPVVGQEISVYVDSEGYILGSVNKQKEAAKNNYIYVLAASGTTTSSNWMVSTPTYTGKVYGILSTGEYGEYTVNYGTTNKAAEKDTVYTYTYDDNGDLVLKTDEVSDGKNTAQIKNGAASAEVQKGKENKVTAILNSSTVFYFYNTDNSGKISSLVTRTGNTSSGVIEASKATVVYEGDAKVAKFVFVGENYTAGAVDVDKAYVVASTKSSETVATGSTQTTIDSYTAYTSTGEEITLYATSGTEITDGVYAYNSNSYISGSAMKLDVDGKITLIGSVIQVGNEYYNYDADHVVFVCDATELKDGQTIKGFVKDGTITEMWVTAAE